MLAGVALAKETNIDHNWLLGNMYVRTEAPRNCTHDLSYFGSFLICFL